MEIHVVCHHEENSRIIPLDYSKIDFIMYDFFDGRELAFSVDDITHKEERYLSKIYLELIKSPYTDVKQIELWYNEKDKITIEWPIMTIVYRTMGYHSASENFFFKDLLSIKFNMDSKVRQDESGMCYCDDCSYLKDNHCIKFDRDIIDGEVCHSCYLFNAQMEHNKVIDKMYERVNADKSSSDR